MMLCINDYICLGLADIPVKLGKPKANQPQSITPKLVLRATKD